MGGGTAGTIALRPIGFVRRGADEQTKVIAVDPKFAEGLAKIEEQEYLWGLYWMHELPEEMRARLQAHPRGDRNRAKQGVFSLHSPFRPNPIGMTRVRLVRREGTRLIVEGLDAREGSPVLDIKSG